MSDEVTNNNECPTCGAYMLNEELHSEFHRRQREQFVNLDHLARQYVPEPRYAGSHLPPPASQTFPRPDDLYELVAKITYRPGWTFALLEDYDRGQGSRGLTLDITTKGYNSYHPERGENYCVHHLWPVIPAAYNRRSWQHWLFEQCLLVERHEACEFFTIDGHKPFAPNHGPGNDPYMIVEVGTAEEAATNFKGNRNT